MADTTSAGLMRYGHFTSSKRAMDLDEPIYLNLFTLSINSSDMPAGMNTTQDDVNIVLEGLRSIAGLDTTPGVGTAGPQKYKWAERGFAGGAPSKTHLELTLTFDMNIRRNGEVNDDYSYKFFRKWTDLIYDPLTGKMSVKKNYICKKMVVTLMDKENVGIHQWQMTNIFPMGALQSIGGGTLSYDDGKIWSGFSIQLWTDTFDEVIP